MNCVFKTLVMMAVSQLLAVSAHGTAAVHPPFVKAWEFKAEAQIDYYAASKDTVYFSTFGSYGAVDLATGRRLWEKPAPSGNGVGLAFDSKTLYIDAGKKIIACPLRSSRLLWSLPKSGVPGPMAIRDKVLYCELEDGILSALDIRTLKLLWSLNLETRPRPKDTPCTLGMSAFPLFWRNKLYVGTDAGEVISINPQTGETQWRHRDDAPGRDAEVSGLAADARRLYCTSFSGRLYALDLRSGALVWSFNIKDANNGIGYGMPMLIKDLAIVGTYSGRIYAVGASDGLQRWKVILPRPIDPGVALPEDESLDSAPWVNTPKYVPGPDDEELSLDFALAVSSGQVIAAVETQFLAYNTSGKQVWKSDHDEYLSCCCPMLLLRDGIVAAGEDRLYRFTMGRPKNVQRNRAGKRNRNSHGRSPSPRPSPALRGRGS